MEIPAQIRKWIEEALVEVYAQKASYDVDELTLQLDSSLLIPAHLPTKISDVSKKLWVLTDDRFVEFCRAYRQRVGGSGIHEVFLENCAIILTEKVADFIKGNVFSLVLHNCYLQSNAALSIKEMHGCTVVSELTLLQKTHADFKNSWFRDSIKFSNSSEFLCQLTHCVVQGEIEQQESNNLNVKCCIVCNLSVGKYSPCSVIDSKIGNFVLREKTGGTQVFYKNIVLENITVSQSALRGKFISEFRLANVRFENTPDLDGKLEFESKNVDFSNVLFSDTASRKAIGVFRSLKQSCEEAGYEHGVIMFHGYELETYYNAHLKENCPRNQVPEKWASLLHKYFTDYGRDLLRPIVILAGIFFVFLALYALIEMGCCMLCFDPDIKQCVAPAYWDRLTLSLRNTLGPLALALPKTMREITVDGNRIPYFLTNTLSFLQIILSSGIWFVLIFMIRRRFKL